MPRQERTGPGVPAVRRAIAVPAAPGEPDASLMPPEASGSPSASSEEASRASVPEGTSGSTPAPSGARSGGPAGESSESSPGASVGRERGRSETSGAAAAASAAPVGSVAPTAATASTAAAASASDDDTQVTASVGADGDDGEPPSGRPAKALLAGAGILGALLLAVPLLFIGGDDDDRSAEQTEPASGVVLPKELRPGAPTPAYGTASPTVSPTPTTSAGGAGSTDTGRNKPGSQSESPAATGTEKSTSASGTTTTASRTPRAASSPKVVAQPAVDIANSKNVMLKNASTGMCADLGGSAKGKLGAGVFQEYCYRGTVDNQMWDFEVRYKGAGADGADVFQIRNVKDGLCMDLPGTGAVAMRTHVREGTCTGTTADNQLWWLESRANGQYWIHNKASNGMCLEVWGADGSGGPDTRLGVYPCSPTDDHEWIVN
ncbi:RICIN domain-containing protein [Streptomyces sp. NBC_01275]|uniref:RICIN domain-containing protein n=1 Tax=Streptomyces sp. NBC_01275 TaxID=2903807 RepID=UPI0022504F9B|nr:RICIN domain-containing protein [Streptomyces sp. NBC_01275]MCX4765875.1 RICIN domain-containing protein [Streptomyces sp. NBC_01275]